MGIQFVNKHHRLKLVPHPRLVGHLLAILWTKMLIHSINCTVRSITLFFIFFIQLIFCAISSIWKHIKKFNLENNDFIVVFFLWFRCIEEQQFWEGLCMVILLGAKNPFWLHFLPAQQGALFGQCGTGYEQLTGSVIIIITAVEFENEIEQILTFKFT